MPCEVFEHTADIGLDVRAPSLDALFRDAACGMLSVIKGPSRVTHAIEVPVDLTHARLDRLFVDLLDELLYHQDAEGLIFSAMDHVRVTGVDDGGAVTGADAEGPWRVRGLAHGERFDRTKHQGCVHVKAVTFHELSVSRDEGTGEWHARVILDI